MLIVRLYVGSRVMDADAAKTEDEAHAKSRAMSRRWRSPARQLGQEMRTETTGLQVLRFPVGTPIREVRARSIDAILPLVGGNAALTAKVLGMSARSVRNHIARQTAPDARAVA